ncbi:nitrate reductase molybdenum cofactor assembly chaperone [Cellulomonas sp. KRMCY2]|uniref:nitrate reductase molybdenum cofactor assembly chaperone n=1 Tax=Cellulomonas sp. KRMCY2 TaxID=1304865 RepID=UPI00045EB294|nr:nitrate reductase molybdenum cofactor assembly chaperone [Cellulomonas sp. KRMCY2]
MNRAARLAAARAAVSREHAIVHRVAALLLEYPSVELLELLPQLRSAVEEVGDRFRLPLLQVVDHLADRPLTELEAQYVTTFDLRRKCALYLTYYAYGDTRKRGVALVEFKQAYRAAGFELAEAELPDHLAVVLEFAATGDAESGIRLLLEHRAGLELLRLALLDAGSPYVGALAAVSATLPALAGDDREAVARLAAEGPPGEDVGLEPFAPPSYMPAMGARR